MNTFPLEKPAAVTRNLLLCCARCLSLVPTRTKQIIFFRCVQKSVLKKYRRRMKTKTSYFPTTTLVSVKPKIIIPGPGLLQSISTGFSQAGKCRCSPHTDPRGTNTLDSTHHPSFVHRLSSLAPSPGVESSASLACRRLQLQASRIIIIGRLHPHHAFIRAAKSTTLHLFIGKRSSRAATSRPPPCMHTTGTGQAAATLPSP